MLKKIAIAVVAATALTAPAALTLAAPALASADIVTDWNRTMVTALEIDKTQPPPSARVGAIVQSAVFDAVNGIARRYTSVHVPADAPRGASRGAAAAEAAHEALVALFPAQQTMLDGHLATSVAQLSAQDDAYSIANGLAWGKTVADAILAWRATDGSDAVLPPYTTAGLPGRWAPTGAALTPVFRQFATMTPFAIASPSQYLPAPPPSLTSARYAQDFNEVKALGSANSTIRTPEQTQTAQFWASDTPTAIWNRVADDLIDQQGGSLLPEARLLARMNLAMADATIAIWNAKNHYDTWRPITAITQAGLDSNPDTSPDPTWTPLLTTPSHQEYPAGHPGLSNAATSVLATFYRDRTTFTATSANIAGVTRSFTRFSDAVAQVKNARVWGGIHFRSAVVTGAGMGGEVAQYVTQTALVPLHGHARGDYSPGGCPLR